MFRDKAVPSSPFWPVMSRSFYLYISMKQIRNTYICRDPKEPPKTIILSPITQEEWPAMGGGPWVVTMQFHLMEAEGRSKSQNHLLHLESIRHKGVVASTKKDSQLPF